MTVPVQLAGSGLGVELLDKAAGRVYYTGVPRLRPDHHTDPHAHYTALGFEHVRTVTIRASGVCFPMLSPALPGHLAQRSAITDV
ncbi:hypothetical protein [Catellatospora sp. TT07R-123]|uniref:hypothetical protein n=1 Tax=Catellatospora sp. TT07R-123 TaxID=2733863 RepID=UPI001BB3421F|nr:hypothetical protein [Catellatospora sp. TT07R-123]